MSRGTATEDSRDRGARGRGEGVEAAGRRELCPHLRHQSPPRPRPGEQAGEPSEQGPVRWFLDVHSRGHLGEKQTRPVQPSHQVGLVEALDAGLLRLCPSVPTFRGRQESAEGGTVGGAGLEQPPFSK